MLVPECVLTVSVEDVNCLKTEVPEVRQMSKSQNCVVNDGTQRFLSF